MNSECKKCEQNVEEYCWFHLRYDHNLNHHDSMHTNDVYIACDDRCPFKNTKQENDKHTA